MSSKRTSEALRDAKSAVLNVSQQVQARSAKRQRVEHADGPNHLRDTIAIDGSSKVVRAEMASTPGSSQRRPTVVVRTVVVTKAQSARSTAPAPLPRPRPRPQSSSSRPMYASAPATQVSRKQVVNPAMRKRQTNARRSDMSTSASASKPRRPSQARAPTQATASSSSRIAHRAHSSSSELERPSAPTPKPLPRVKVPEFDPVAFRKNMEAIGMGWYKLPLTQAQMPKFRKKSETGAASLSLGSRVRLLRDP
ncbi:hypothetical protein C8Q80DRAFT_216881 [Daedaleopsis nitida]|nr:hypothetical protein C8Q80DRAFT_216881 [Daedaleopsis nitida]